MQIVNIINSINYTYITIIYSANNNFINIIQIFTGHAIINYMVMI